MLIQKVDLSRCFCVSVEIRGLDEVFELLDGISDASKMKDALNKSCLLVERTAKEKAPKGKTGDLRRFITSEVQGYEGVVYAPLEYAPYVEFGTGLFAENGGRSDVPWSYQDDEGEWHSTSGMKPQPFMRPALDENREEIIKILGEAIKPK